MRRLTSSPLVRNIMAVASGTAAGQAVVFVFSPLIARIYSPETFGLQGVFLSLVSILSPAIALRYPMAIVVAKDDGEARSMMCLSLIIAFGLSCLLGLALSVAGRPITRLLGAEALGPLIWFLPLALFCVSLQDVMDYRAARLSAFRLVAKVTVVHAFLTNLARVLGGLAAPVAATLVAVTSLAPAVQAALLRAGTRKIGQPAPPLTFTGALLLARAHRDFPLYRAPTDVLNSASQSVPVILLAALFSPTAAGLYTLTRSVLNLPSNVISSAVGNVLYVRFAELAREGRPLRPLLLRSTGMLLALTPIIIGVAWFAPTVFAFVFGERWRESGNYAQWMALWIAMMIVNVPTAKIAPVISEQRILLIFNIILLLVRIIIVVSAAKFSSDAMTAVIWFSISSAIMIIISISIFIWRTMVFDRRSMER